MQSEKLALMESMKQELEEKIRKLEEDKQNMDISAGIFFFCVLMQVWQKYSGVYMYVLFNCAVNYAGNEQSISQNWWV